MNERSANVRVAPSALEPDAEEALRSAIGAVAMLGHDKVQALLNLPDTELGRLVKFGLAQLADLSASVTFEGHFVSREKKQSMPTGRPSSQEVDEGASDSVSRTGGRQLLVAERKLLPAAEIWQRLGITRRALSEALAAGRIFTLDVGARRYYPAFYLHRDVDCRGLERATQLLGSLPGWSKWQFFTTPNASLGKLTPLQALSRGMLGPVERAAKAFAEQ